MNITEMGPKWKFDGEKHSSALKHCDQYELRVKIFSLDMICILIV